MAAVPLALRHRNFNARSVSCLPPSKFCWTCFTHGFYAVRRPDSVEALAPARALPAVPGWKLRGGIAFVAYFFLSSYLPCSGPSTSRGSSLDLAPLGRWPAPASESLFTRYSYMRGIGPCMA